MILAAVKDLFFVARIRETARLVGAGVRFARTPEDIANALAAETPALIILDLTTPEQDLEALLGAVAARAPEVPVLGFTTHALARQTQPFHARCSRVVTKETLSRELGEVLRCATPDGRPRPASSPSAHGSPA